MGSACSRVIPSPFMHPETLLQLISAAPADRIAMILPESGARVPYGQLVNHVTRLADTLAGAGVGRGDRVAIAIPNGMATIVSFLAASVAGTAAPLNPNYRLDEFNFYMEDTNAKVLLAPANGAEDARKAAASRGIPVIDVDASETGDLIIGNAPAVGKASAPSGDDIALVLHTSGSTGRPKRVPLMHKNLTVSARNIVNTYNLSDSDVALCVMPLFHVHGLVASTMSTLYSGGTVVVPAKFSPLSFWRVVRDTGATWYSAVPTIHQLLLARMGNEKPKGAETLRFMRSCSAPMPVEVAKKMEELVGVSMLEAYGMTEASHQMASNPLAPRERKLGTVGPGTGVEIGIMDQAGNLLRQGELGEVVIKGPNVVDGYENNPEANATSYTNGWFRTGDQGTLDSEGYLKLTGRLKEMINRGGEKISPVEIDEILLLHPKVAEAVSFAMPHPTWGEEVAAAIVTKEPATEAEVVAFCKERLADFKVPKKIHIIKEIPRTATGKVQRRNVAAVLLGS